MTDKDYVKIAKEKCWAIETLQSCKEQTLASEVASVALQIAENMRHPDASIQTLHRAADFILATVGLHVGDPMG